MGNRKLLNRIMVYDVYLRQLVTLAVEKQREYRIEDFKAQVGPFAEGE